MRTYIGSKIIKAEPMSEKVFFGRADVDTNRDGYVVEHPDKHRIWCPKDVFETAYRELTQEEHALILTGNGANPRQGPGDGS